MKRLFKVMSASLIALLAILTLGSCDVKQQFKQEILKEDSLMVTKMMAGVDNPVFYGAEDAITYQRSENQWRKQDSAFFAIPEKVMPNIIAVLQKNRDPLTKMSIATEFENNKRIYLNLPDKPDMYEAMTPPDIPNTKTVDTIIDGKRVQITESKSPDIHIKVTNTEDQL